MGIKIYSSVQYVWLKVKTPKLSLHSFSMHVLEVMLAKWEVPRQLPGNLELNAERVRTETERCWVSLQETKRSQSMFFWMKLPGEPGLSITNDFDKYHKWNDMCKYCMVYNKV